MSAGLAKISRGSIRRPEDPRGGRLSMKKNLETRGDASDGTENAFVPVGTF